MNTISSLIFGLALLGATSASASDRAVSATGAPQIVLAAESESAMPLTQILKLEPSHLMTLGAGLVVGAAVIGPLLVTGEVVGIAIGVIAGELYYRAGLWPLERAHGPLGERPSWF